MKKRIKTLVALGLAMAMVTGCGNTVQKENEKTSEVKESSSSVEESAAESSVEEESPYPEYLNMESARPVVKEGEEVTLKVGILRSPTAQTEIEDLWFLHFIEEELNIGLEIEEYTNDNLNERKNLMMVSGDVPDLLINLEFSNAEVVQYGVGEGMLLPLSDYLSEELTPNIMAALEGHEDAVMGNTASDGKMYTLPTFMSTAQGYGDTIPRTRVFVDTKYLDAAGITELPTTLDGFADMLRAFKALDPEEMGVETIYPMISDSGARDREYILNAFGWITDHGNQPAYPCWDTVNDEITIQCMDDKFEDYLTYMNMLYTEGLIHPDYFTLDNTAANAIMAERAAGVVAVAAPYLNTPDEYEEFVSMGIMTSDVEPDPYIVARTAYGQGKILVSANTEYPEVCMRFLDYLYSDEGIVYCQLGPVAGTEETYDLIEGFTVDAEGNLVYADSTYESNYEYRLNKISLWDGHLDEDRASKGSYEMGTGKEYKGIELDPNAGGNDHYLYSIVEAFEGYEDYIVTFRPEIYATAEQNEKFTDLQSTLKSYTRAETAKFIVGERPLSEFEDFQAEVIAMGGQEFLDLVREMYKHYSADTK